MKQSSFKLDRKRLADQIIEKLASMIANGDFMPGDKLPTEIELMKLFGVGRSSIREALGALSLIGMVTARAGHGTRVAVLSEESQSKPIGLMLTIGKSKIRELVEARIIIEQATVRLAAERATKKDLVEIKRHLDYLKTSTTINKKVIKADLGFHNAIAKACHNSVLNRFLSELRQPMKHWMEQKAKYDWGYEKVYEQHLKIVEAIESHDGERAQTAMRNHLESTGEKLVTAIMELESEKSKATGG